MSKWLKRFIAAVLLLTFQPGIPVAVQTDCKINNEPYAARSIFNLELVRAAEADDENDGCMARCGKVGFGLVTLAAIFIPGFMPFLIGIVIFVAVIYMVIAYLFTGDKRYDILP